VRNTRALSILTLAAALAAATACGHKETFEEHQQHELADNLKKAETGDTQAMYEAASAYGFLQSDDLVPQSRRQGRPQRHV
jgi:ABC-type oligopeptide transport system substrate-binding subunit